MTLIEYTLRGGEGGEDAEEEKLIDDVGVKQVVPLMAREQVDVTTIVFVNHSYRILNIELYRTGAGNPGPTAKNMLSIGGPDIDWVALSEAMGVPAVEAATAEAFDAALEKAIAAPGPRLIAAIVPG